MADLDDFFAKKDRKKAKGKKFTTTEEIAKKLEETGKKVDKLKLKEKPANPESVGDDNHKTEEEDEWREFEEEKKDYSGLKIGNLTVNEHESNEIIEERGTGENSSDGESGEGGGKHSGPWKKQDLPPVPPVQEPEPVPQQAPPAQPSTGGAYKIPQHRAGGAPQPDRVIGRLRNRNIAPDINSEEYFPTLNSKGPVANESIGAWGKKKHEGTFEEVKNRGAGRMYFPDNQTQAPKLSLGNKYGALQDQS